MTNTFFLFFFLHLLRLQGGGQTLPEGGKKKNQTGYFVRKVHFEKIRAHPVGAPAH